MKTIKQTYLIDAPFEEVWKALVDPVYIDGWGGGPAEMDDKKGTKFSLWGGEIWGTNIEVIPNKKLVQEWYSKGEIKDKPSKATFELHEDKGKTRLELVHEEVPDDVVDDIDNGWKDYYLGPLKSFLESE